MEDGRCRLGLGGRRELVRLIEDGQSLRAAARRLGVAPATAHRWWHRWAGAPEPERSSGACLQSRPPRPRSCPWQLGPEEERAILTARERTNLGPARLAGQVGRRRSTIWKVLHRLAPRIPDGAMSGQSPEPCCTSTPSSWRALPDPGTSPTAIGPRPTAVAGPAMSLPTAWSMTAVAWPMSSCSPTSAVRPARRYWGGPGWRSRAAGRPRR